MDLTKRARNHTILIFVLLLLLLIRFNGIIIFKNPIIQELLFILAYVCVIVAFVHSFSLTNLFAKILSSVIFGIITLVGFPFLFLSGADLAGTIARGGKDYSFECINEIKYNAQKIKVYRTNGGATTAFGIIVREEKEILPGLLYVHKLFDRYPMETVGMKIENDTTLLLMDTYNNNIVIQRTNLSN